MTGDILVVLDQPGRLPATLELLPQLGLKPRVVFGGAAGIEGLHIRIPDRLLLFHWDDDLDPLGFLRAVAEYFPEINRKVIAVAPAGAPAIRELLLEAGCALVIEHTPDEGRLISLLGNLPPFVASATAAGARPPQPAESLLTIYDSQTVPVLERSFNPRSLAKGALIDDRYRVVARLGSGSMATVYATMDEHLEQSVAVKLMHSTEVADAVRRFRRETLLARDIVHPNVVRTYEAGQYRGHPYLTMELLAGTPLAPRIERGERFSVRETAAVGRAIARGLDAIHAHGVDHRDLSAGNVFLLGGERVACILDFGAARLEDDSMGVHSGGYVIGTPAILPPERILGTPELPGAADSWALGVLLYSMLCGNGPFAEAEPFELLRHITEVRVQPPIELVWMPVAFSKLIVGLLDKDPAARAKVSDAAHALGILRAAWDLTGPGPLPANGSSRMGQPDR